MRIRHRLLTAAMMAGVGLAGLASQAFAAPPMTADDIIARQVEARGGREAMSAIKTLRFEGELVFPGDFRLAIVQTKARPGKVRTDATIQGLTVVQAYDGAQGWQIQPFQGRKDAEVQSGDDIKDMVDDADVDGPLIDYKAKGNVVEYLGTEDVDGTPAYKLRLTEKSGDQLVYFIDTDSLMTVRLFTKRLLRGREQDSVTDFGDYEKVGGVYYPFESETAPPGVTDKQKITFTKGEANIAVADTLFAMPKSAAK